MEDLKTSCQAISSMTKDIFTPAVGECLVIGEETKSFSVRLGDTIMASLKMSRVSLMFSFRDLLFEDLFLTRRRIFVQVEDYDVAYVSGVIHFDPESDLPILERTPLSSMTSLALLAPAITESDTIPVKEGDEADTVMATESSSLEHVLPPLTPALFIGDLRLTVLKERLQSLNIPAEFAGEGTLICGPAPPESFGFISSRVQVVDPRRGAKAVAESNAVEAAEAAGGKVAVKKLGRGRLVIDGTPGETYHAVRRVVYSLHAHAS